MFDMKRELGIPLLDKKILCRMPSDAETGNWRRSKKISQKDLGRRSFQMEPAKPEKADLELFNKIQLADESGVKVEVDEAEAFHIINTILACDVNEQPERHGSEFVIKLKAMNRFKTVHTLKMPTMRDMLEYERNRNSVIFGQFGKQEIRINFSAAGELYDKLVKSTEGYEGGIVPIAHKAEAVNALLQEIRASQEEEEGEDSLGE